jgi:hypothetical protein
VRKLLERTHCIVSTRCEGVSKLLSFSEERTESRLFKPSSLNVEKQAFRKNSFSMPTLEIHLSGQPPETTNHPFACNTWDYDVLWQHISAAGELTGQPLARLIRRLQARHPVTLHLRSDTNPEPLISWLKNAGAEVTYHGQSPNPSASSPTLAVTSVETTI